IRRIKTNKNGPAWDRSSRKTKEECVDLNWPICTIQGAPQLSRAANERNVSVVRQKSGYTAPPWHVGAQCLGDLSRAWSKRIRWSAEADRIADQKSWHAYQQLDAPTVAAYAANAVKYLQPIQPRQCKGVVDRERNGAQ